MSAIDLSQLPAPTVIESLNYEAILAARKTEFLALINPEDRDQWQARLELESDPVTKILQSCAYREIILRQRINEAAAAVMIKYAIGADLDNLAANLNVQRLVISEANPNTTPPTLVVKESDAALRARTQMAMEGLSTAGPEQSYRYHGLSADGQVRDIAVESPNPAYITVTVLSHAADGIAPPSLIAKVNAAITGKDRRPLADRVTVQSATIIPYQIQATITVARLTPESELIKTAAQKSLQDFTQNAFVLGRDIYRSALHDAMHVTGVIKVDLTNWADLDCDPSQAPQCTAMVISMQADQ